MIYKFKIEELETVENLINKVKEVHKQLFPKATLETQCAKFEEEYQEALKADGEDFMKELADMFIVACGIGNFNFPISTFLCNYIIIKVEQNKDSDVLSPLFYHFVCEKMNKNQERVWNETEEGYYKHKVHNNSEKE